MRLDFKTGQKNCVFPLILPCEMPPSRSGKLLEIPVELEH